MRPLVLLLFLVFGAGCAGSAAPLVPLPVPDIEREAPPPAPVPVAVEVEVVQPPVVPPPVPERRIARRAVYEDAGLIEWTLENGLTVVYVQYPVEGYHARLDAPTGWAGLPESDRPAYAHIGAGRWGALTARLGPGSREAVGESDSLSDLVESIRSLLTSPPDAVDSFDMVADAAPRWGLVLPETRADGGARRLAEAFGQPAAFTVVLVGALGPEWIEPMIASWLSVRPGGGPTFERADPATQGDQPLPAGWRGVVSEWEVSAGWEDRPAALLLREILAARAGRDARADLWFDAARETLRLRLASATSSNERALHAPLQAAEVEVARRRAVDRAASAAGVADAVSELYGLRGRFRPARRPEDPAVLAAAIARTPAGRLDALLQRLLASPDTARFSTLTDSP